jgi:hypothetical protein
LQSQHPAIGGGVCAGACEIVERALGHADDVVLNELRALGCTLLGMLDAALPFEHGPTVVVVLRESGEDAVEVDLPVAERAETPGALDPWRIARVDALLRRRIELRILDVKDLDARVIRVEG